MLHLEARDESVAGILTHSSLIHPPPGLRARVLARFARVVELGGLVVGGQLTDTADANGWVPTTTECRRRICGPVTRSPIGSVRTTLAELGGLRIVASALGKPSGC